jgi:hypothetical protein
MPQASFDELELAHEHRIAHLRTKRTDCGQNACVERVLPCELQTRLRVTFRRRQRNCFGVNIPVESELLTLNDSVSAKWAPLRIEEEANYGSCQERYEVVERRRSRPNSVTPKQVTVAR